MPFMGEGRGGHLIAYWLLGFILILILLFLRILLFNWAGGSLGRTGGIWRVVNVAIRYYSRSECEEEL